MSEITHSHDQAIQLGRDLLERADEEVDTQIERSLLAGSPDIAITFGYDIIKTGQMRGVQLARLLYSLDEVWDRFQTDDTIEDALLKGMGVSGKNFRQYRDLYKYVLRDHPELSGKPIGGLLGIVVAAREEEFEPKDWKDISLAHDSAAMVAIRQRVRGTHTSGHSRLVGWIDRDGYVWARIGNKAQESAGNLNVGASPDSAAGRLVTRILENSGIERI